MKDPGSSEKGKIGELRAENQQLASKVRELEKTVDAIRSGEAKVPVASDIAGRKRLEEEQQTALQRFYAVLSSMYGSILLVADDGQIEFANQAFCDLFDLKESPADLTRLRSPEMIQKIKHGYLHPEEEVKRIGEIVGRGQPVKGEEIAMHDGRTCLRDFIPLYIVGRSYGRLWHHIEITGRKRAEEELRRHAVEVQAANEELNRFNRAMVDRELRMIELKEQVNELSVRLGQPEPYTLNLEEKQP